MARDRTDDLGVDVAAADRGVVIHPHTYIVPALMLTLCCFPPGGIVALFYSLQVNPKWAAGDSLGARRSSELAKMWCWLAFGVGIIADFFLAAVTLPGLSASGVR